MRKIILTALIVATAMPAAAMAQSPERRRDRDYREEQRRPDARTRDDRRDYRDDRRDPRNDGRGYRDDRNDRNDRSRNWGRNDWRGYRDSNRGVFAGGNWRAPFRYNSFRPGVRIQSSYYGSRYWIADPWRYRLPQAGRNQRWVRHYNDVLLIDYRRGIVIDVIRSLYW